MALQAEHLFWISYPIVSVLDQNHLVLTVNADGDMAHLARRPDVLAVGGHCPLSGHLKIWAFADIMPSSWMSRTSWGR